MNALTDTIDAAVLRAAKGMAGFATNEEVRDAIGDDWPLPRHEPTPTRIGKAMARLGYSPWRQATVRGWDMSTSND